MNQHKRTWNMLAAAFAGLLAASELAHGAMPMLDVDLDAKQRALIAKHKAKQGGGSSTTNSDSGQNGQSDCGSQEIGNVNTAGGRPGQGPREVVIVGQFTNIVSGKCR
jgi:hypothetical protein